MVQATDGNWYAYIASKSHAMSVNDNNTGINFGLIPGDAQLNDVDGDAWPEANSGDTEVYRMSNGSTVMSDFNVIREANNQIRTTMIMRLV